MNSRLLLRLDDADVPGEIVDLMMALSFPEYFAVKDEPESPRTVVYSHYWTPWFSPYGYGFGHYYPYPPPPETGPPGPRPGGKVISGHGYTRVDPTNLPPGGFTGFMQRVSNAGGGGGGGGGMGGGGTTSGTSSSGSNGGSDSSASSSGYQGGGSSSDRKAVPR
jgi:hypothetical protein